MVGQLRITFESDQKKAKDPRLSRVECSYQKLRRGKPALSISIGVKFIRDGGDLSALERDAVGLCWASHGLDRQDIEALEAELDDSPPGVRPVFNVYPVGDHYIHGWYSLSHDRLSAQGRREASRLVRDFHKDAKDCTDDGTQGAAVDDVDPVGPVGFPEGSFADLLPELLGGLDEVDPTVRTWLVLWLILSGRAATCADEAECLGFDRDPQ